MDSGRTMNEVWKLETFKLDRKLCVGCPLEHLLDKPGYGLVHPEGTGENGVALMGESPELDELRGGHPFAGRSGGLLTNVCRLIGEARKRFAPIFNLCQCRVPGGLGSGTHQEAIEHCEGHRRAILKHFKPHTVVPMGNFGLEEFSGETFDESGTKYGITKRRGYPYYSSKYDVRVIPTLHPSFIIGGDKRRHVNPKAMIHFTIQDIKKALNKDLPVVDPKPSLLPGALFPSPQNFQKFITNFTGTWLMIDIETPMRPKNLPNHKYLSYEDPSVTLLRCAFAYWDGEEAQSITVPWQEPYIAYIKPLLADPKVGQAYFNHSYDMDRLEYNDVELKGDIYDVMWLWHFLFSDLPRALEDVAPRYINVREWKSQSTSAPELYSWMDGYVQTHCLVGVLRELESVGLKDAAHWQVTLLLGVLRKMHKRGIPLDGDGLTKFREGLGNERESILEELNVLVPDALKNVHPKSGYVRTPKDTTGLTLRTFPLTNPKHIEKYGDTVERYCNVIPFKPSNDQVQRMMMHLEHEIPVDGKDKKKTTAAKYLKRRITDHPIYKKILDYRTTEKWEKTYASWHIWPDGKIHPYFEPLPATGRLSSHDPNAQNMPQHSDLAHAFRQMIRAPQGYCFNRRDYKGFEAKLTGFFSGEELIIQLSDVGIHAWVTGHYLKDTVVMDMGIKHPLLKDACDAIKEADPVLYRKIKTTIFAIFFGSGPRRIYNENPGVFENYTEAYRMRKFIFQLFPSLKKWQDNTVIRARMEHIVRLPFGNNRWLWDIPGSDGPRAIAQWAQGCAAAIIKRAMIAIDNDPFTEPYMISQVHDELILCPPITLADEVDDKMKHYMELPVPELGDMVFLTERKVGANLDE
jgi:uracil-DNA glycosylase family 4